MASLAVSFSVLVTYMLLTRLEYKCENCKALNQACPYIYRDSACEVSIMLLTRFKSLTVLQLLELYSAASVAALPEELD
jgi:hypothetical protein